VAIGVQPKPCDSDYRLVGFAENKRLKVLLTDLCKRKTLLVG
jgi:hypothetical protein